ncbi:DnaJ domain containing protein [Nitzschia inconspicua]|uniref:DnaJ domain containing protein n=1 Tax=Nitzschia inconspicua TaxID=303405 RepID=A0A9K3L9U6_9STRA|nr:DnaJ domain containing protein [Nitzschia inconspicua]
MMNDSTSFLFFACKVAIVCVVFWNQFHHAKGFTTSTTSSHHQQQHQHHLSQRTNLYHTPSSATITILAAATRGMGMGMGTASSTKKNNKKKNGSKPSSSTATATTTSPFDVSASLIRLEKKYDELMLNAAKELQRDEQVDDDNNNNNNKQGSSSTSATTTPMMTSEYVIAARAAVATKTQGKPTIPDWVPIAQMCLRRPESEYQDGASDVMVQMAVSAYCRELSHVASFGAPVFSKIARNQLQYSVESVDSFRKFVYDEVVEGKAKQNQDEVMTKAEARETLGLINNNNINNNTTTNGASDISKSEIKQAYRRLSFDLHPDRFQGTPEECEAAAHQFSKVKIAYETLSSGVRGLDGISWYESLGGRARTGFVGPVNLLPLAAAQEHLSRHKAEGAICGLDPVLVQSFVARHLRSE